MRRALAIDEKSFGPTIPTVGRRDLNNLALTAAGHQPAGRGRAAVAACARHRREELRSRPSQCCHQPQQPGPASPGHQSAGRGRAADAPGARHRREELRPRPSRRRHRLNNLAVLLQATNRLAEAEPLMRRALAIDEKSFGPDHPNVAHQPQQLGPSCCRTPTGSPRPSRSDAPRAVAIDEKSFGPDHPNVASGLNNLAQLLQATNRLAEAEPLMRRALAIDEKSFGPIIPRRHRPQQPGPAAAGHQPAGRGRAADAPRARHQREELRPRPSQCRHSLNNLAGLLQATNRLAEAEPLDAPCARDRREELRP